MALSRDWMILGVVTFLLGTIVHAEEVLNLIPMPQKIERSTETLTLTSSCSMGFSKGIKKEFAEHCAGLLREATRWEIPVGRNGTVNFKLAPALNLSEEGYQLWVSSDQVKIVASTQKGLFYGFQTLRQLMPPAAFGSASTPVKSWTIPAVKIEDEPRYAWRGILVDVSRKFQTTETIKMLLDAMATCKLNTFHWHLTDNQGWRVEIEKYPKLTTTDFYTRAEIRNIIEYARLRNIQVIPEIDLPGHSKAATRAYPNLVCRDAQGKKLTQSGTYCPGESACYTFLEEVLSEVVSLFPAPYIHLGADEVGRGSWKKCTDCQK